MAAAKQNWDNMQTKSVQEIKQQYIKRFQAIKMEHYNWLPAFKDLGDYVNPARGIFNNDRTRVGKMFDHKRILSAHSTHALKVFASGLNSGMTNKASYWFRLKIGNDQAILDKEGVRQWIDDVETLMYDILNKSNIYEVFYSAYEELGQFGTACFIILEDFDDVIRARSFTCGEYFLACDNKGRPNAFAREFKMTVGQMVQEFGLESCSVQVKAAHNDGRVDDLISVCHLIEENTDRNPDMADYNNMAFRSAYWESGNNSNDFLAKRGFKKFCIVAPRWETITTDMVYGYGPGWHALGAIKELQKTRFDKLVMQDKIINPPTMQDASVQGHTNLMPGGVTRISGNVPNTGVRPTYQVPPAVDVMLQAIEECKTEIDKFFFVNLFLMLINVETGKMTATEVTERQQEKIMMMGPALHRLDKEMLTKTLELVFEIASDNGLIPEPPEAIAGMEIKIEFTSILAQMQKAVGITKIERVLGLAMSAAQAFPQVLDNIDIDEAIREVNEMEGAPSKIILNKEIVQGIREERQRQQNMALAMQAASAGADAINKAGNTPMGTGSALDGILKSMPGR